MDDTLTIPEIMIKKEAMCDLIIDIIERFEKQTGLCVKSIDIERIRTINDQYGQALVNIEISL